MIDLNLEVYIQNCNWVIRNIIYINLPIHFFRKFQPDRFSGFSYKFKRIYSYMNIL